MCVVTYHRVKIRFVLYPLTYNHLSLQNQCKISIYNKRCKQEVKNETSNTS